MKKKNVNLKKKRKKKLRYQQIKNEHYIPKVFVQYLQVISGILRVVFNNIEVSGSEIFQLN